MNDGGNDGAAAAAAEEEEEEDEEEEGEGEEEGAAMTATQARQHVHALLDDFEDTAHPLTAHAHDQFVKGMYSEWTTMGSNIDRAVELFGNLAERRADVRGADMGGANRRRGSHGDADETEDAEDARQQEEDEKLAALDEGFLALADLREEMQWRRQALQEIRTQIASGRVVRVQGNFVGGWRDPLHCADKLLDFSSFFFWLRQSDAAGMYDARVAELAAAYKAKSRRARYGQNKEYEQYRSRVWDALHEEPMPPLVELLSGGGGGGGGGGAESAALAGADDEQEDDDEDDEDIVAYGSSAQNYKCPLSLQIMINPLKSTVCTHAFERDTILDYLGGPGRTRPCPTQCAARLNKTTLVEDAAFTRACRNHARRVERRRQRQRTQHQATLLD